MTSPYSRILMLGAECEARGYCRAPPAPVHVGLGGPASWSECCGEENLFMHLQCCTVQRIDWTVGWTVRGSFLAGADCLSLPQNMQSGSETHPAFSLVCTECLLAGSKTAGSFIYSPRCWCCPYRAIFGKNNQYYWKLLVYRKS